MPTTLSTNSIKKKFEKTKNTGFTYLFGDVDFDSCKKVISDLNNFSQNDDYDQILLTICSTGGKLNPAFALYDHILASPKPVFCLASGWCGSAAVVILQSGIERLATINTRFKLHSSSYWVDSVPFAELELLTQNNKFSYDLFVKLTTEKSGKTIQEFEKECIPVKFLSIQEALDFGKNGLVDRIL